MSSRHRSKRPQGRRRRDAAKSPRPLRRRARRARSWAITCCTSSADLATHLAYLQQHALLPSEIKRWSAEQLRELFEAALLTGRVQDWQRALLFAAHHESVFAAKLLAAQEDQVPEALRGYWELAYGEALGWLGLDFCAETGSAATAPVGVAAPSEEPN